MELFILGFAKLSPPLICFFAPFDNKDSLLKKNRAVWGMKLHREEIHAFASHIMNSAVTAELRAGH